MLRPENYTHPLYAVARGLAPTPEGRADRGAEEGDLPETAIDVCVPGESCAVLVCADGTGRE